MKIDLVMMSKLSPSGGGRETWLYNFLNEIIESQINVKFNLYTLATKEKTIINAKNDGLIGAHKEYTHRGKIIPTPIGFSCYMLLNQLWKRKNSEYVVAVGGLNEAIATFLSYSIFGVEKKKIIWLRTIYTKEKGYKLTRFSQKILIALEVILYNKYFDLVITNGDDTADFYRRLGINCHVIKNSIPLKKWHQLKPPSFRGILKIAFIGRLSEVKGIKNFLESIDYVKDTKYKDYFEFHVVGDGPFEKQIRQYAADKLLIYHGAIPNTEIPDILKDIHCCVALTHLSDFLGGGGVSNALLEQMAAEKIIICWNNNIFRKVLDNYSGYFVNQDDSNALAECFINILLNFSQAALKAKVAKNLSSQYCIHEHVSEFFNLIGTE